MQNTIPDISLESMKWDVPVILQIFDTAGVWSESES